GRRRKLRRPDGDRLLGGSGRQIATGAGRRRGRGGSRGEGGLMAMLIATDAWRPQINGVVHSLEQMAAAARQQGVAIDFLTPQGFRTVPMPTYPDIKLALASWPAVARRSERSGALLFQSPA